MPQLTINGKTVSVASGSSVLDALMQAELDVPTLCFDRRLAGHSQDSGSCRLCAVRVAGSSHLVTACNTPAIEGMQVTTHDEELEELRRTNLRLLARHYPASAVSANPAREFHHWLQFYGIDKELREHSNPDKVDSSHVYLHVDMNQCITCYRCVRICDHVQGQFVWRVEGRGSELRIVPDSGTTLAESSCVSCGACADTCPTGAIIDRSLLELPKPEIFSRTTCHYCGVGCEMDVGVARDRIVDVRPALNSPVNKGHLCVKGRYAFKFTDATDRASSPLLRRNGKLISCTWDEAYAAIVENISRIIATTGGSSVGMLGSARATNEENYLTQKFARIVLGTNNVDCCARVCHTPTAAAMKLMLGTGAATNSFDDIESAATFLLCGTNATENHPVVGARIRQQVLRGAKLIVIDPRRTELAELATFHLALRPGTNVALLNGLAAAIIAENLVDPEFLRTRVAGVEEYRDFIAQFSPANVAEICQVPAEQIVGAARLYAQHGPAMCFHGLGVTEHVQGTDGVMCLVNLALLTGNIGKPGSGINPLRGQNNVQGSAVMGCEPANLTGSVSLTSERERFEKLWQSAIPQTPGLHLLAMMDAATAGTLKALWVVGYDVLLTNANATATRNAFEQLEFVVVQDLFVNETAREFATVFLPAASGFEKDGTYMNSERRISRVRQVISPRGQSKSDWEILCEAAALFGKGEHFQYGSAKQIWDEVRQVWPAVSGISYERIEEQGLQWPCPKETHPGTKVLHAKEFPIGSRATLQRIPHQPSSEQTDFEFPLLLTTGRTLYQFNAGTMTQRTGNKLLRPEDLLELHPDDAKRFGVDDQQRVRVRSRHGSTTLAVQLTKRVKPGEAFATFHSAESLLNNITSPNRDRRVSTPEYKVTAIQLEKL